MLSLKKFSSIFSIEPHRIFGCKCRQRHADSWRNFDYSGWWIFDSYLFNFWLHVYIKTEYSNLTSVVSSVEIKGMNTRTHRIISVRFFLVLFVNVHGWICRICTCNAHNSKHSNCCHSNNHFISHYVSLSVLPDNKRTSRHEKHEELTPQCQEKIRKNSWIHDGDRNFRSENMTKMFEEMCFVAMRDLCLCVCLSSHARSLSLAPIQHCVCACFVYIKQRSRSFNQTLHRTCIAMVTVCFVNPT